MKNTTAVIGGKEYTLRFDMEAWERLEDEVCLVDDLGKMLEGRGRIKTTLQVFAIFAKADVEEIRKNALPTDIRMMMRAIWKAFNDGMHVEAEHGEDREVDVTLEEIEKKGEPVV
ncbi:MAG: hypothetical protein IJI68_10220 [Eggerthellaceae bacterium]|nr:hypothetical protein [Eggerthellaceae bacterium]